MTLAFLLILMIPSKDFPTVKIMNQFDSKSKCEDTITRLVDDNGLTKEQAKMFKCLPIVTSKLTET